MDCMASKAATKNGLVLSSLPAASGIVVQLRPARRPNVSLIWQANQIAETGSNHGSLPYGPDDRTLVRPHQPDGVLDQVKAKPLRGVPPGRP
jgi:hypothetical protein